jgi:hypothetical protein
MLQVASNTTNRVNLYYCALCGNKYIKEETRNKHFILCQIKIDTKKQKRKSRVQEEEEGIYERLPTQREMARLIVNLTYKNDQLEQKVNELTKWVETKKKKIDIVSWLNTSNAHIPSFSFNTWHDNVVIDDTGIKFFLENDFYSSFVEIFLTLNAHYETLPLTAFDQKPNTIYSYQAVEDQPATWQVLSNENLIYCLKLVHWRCIKTFRNWKNTSICNSAEDPEFHAYNLAIIKWIEKDFTNLSTLGRIKRDLYDKIQVNFKNITEYEL